LVGGVGGVGLLQGFGDDGGEGFEVGAGSDFRDDAAEFLVEVDLGGDDAGEDVNAIADNGGGGFVAGGFDAEDEHSDSAVNGLNTKA
jgi:hypothetical protein